MIILDRDLCEVWAQWPTANLPGSIPTPEELWALAAAAPSGLNLGCGVGRLERELGNILPQRWLGLDISASAVAAASRAVPLPCRFQVADVRHPLPSDGKFDLACMIGVLNLPGHAHPREELSSKRHGYLFFHGALFASPISSRTGIFPRYEARYLHGERAGLELGAFIVEDQPPVDLPPYIARHFTEEEVRGLVTDMGGTVVSFRRRKAPSRTGHLLESFVATISFVQ